MFSLWTWPGASIGWPPATLTLMSSMRFSRSALDFRSTGFSMRTLIRRSPLVTSSSIFTLSNGGAGAPLPDVFDLRRWSHKLSGTLGDWEDSYLACWTSRNCSRKMICVLITRRDMLPCFPWVSSTRESPWDIKVAASGAISNRRSSL